MAYYEMGEKSKNFEETIRCNSLLKFKPGVFRVVSSYLIQMPHKFKNGERQKGEKTIRE